MSLLSSYALEQRLAALRYARWAQYNASPIEEIASKMDAATKQVVEQDLRGFAGNAALTLEQGETYYIRSGPIEIITAEAVVLDLQTLRCNPNLTEPSGFMWLERSPLKLKDLTSFGVPIPDCEINAISWCWTTRAKIHHEDHSEVCSGLLVIAYEKCLDGEVEPKMNLFIKNGDVLIEEKEGVVSARVVISFLIAACAFMRQKLVMNVPQPVNRQTRKRIVDTWSGETFIRDIQLRRRDYEARVAYGLTTRDYTCRWWVRGHWRMQPYSSIGNIIPIFIEPYIKGPKDKPIKPASTPIFVVNR